MSTSTIATPVVPAWSGFAPSPQPKLWTCAEFHELGEKGLFEGKRAMLIDGVILEEGPMNPPHRMALEFTTEAIRTAFGPGWRVCGQMPLNLSLTTDPQPDLAVIRGNPRGATSHPISADLVIEIADSSLAFDTQEKASLYAAGRIGDYWVLDVSGRQLLVFRDPRPDASQPHGHAYATRLTFTSGQTVAPLAIPNSAVAVVDLLP